MKLLRIYKNGIEFSRMVAEILQDYLDDYIHVSVGKESKIYPHFWLKRKLII